MLNFLLKQRRKKGFTIVELIVVVAIIAVLAAILIPTFINYLVQAQIASANTSAASIKRTVESFVSELTVQGKGLKIGRGINSQIMFMVDKGVWLVKAESKGNGRNDPDGHMSFNDHKNWWGSNATFMMTDETTTFDQNHLLALCRAVANTCEGLNTGFIMAFFTNGHCAGVVYIPDCNYLWPGSYSGIPGDIQRGRPQLRPLLVHGRTDPVPRMKEFSPWAGVWPEYANSDFWDGQAGIDKDGFYVGTSPVIKYGETS